ncbi:MAG: hypothetical protein AB4206_00595 [Xenococcaceae cyanobacterium]
MTTILIGMGGCQELIDDSLVALGKEELAITSVTQIQKKKSGRKIYVRGKVIHRSPFLGSAAYQLKDDTGNVWVFTDNPLPNQGEEVFIKGKVQQESLPIQEQELGSFYLIELQQLTNANQN